MNGLSLQAGRLRILPRRQTRQVSPALSASASKSWLGTAKRTIDGLQKGRCQSLVLKTSVAGPFQAAPAAQQPSTAAEKRRQTRSKRRKQSLKHLTGVAAQDKLRLRGVKEATLARYRDCIADFEEWAKSHGKSTARDSLDKTVSEFLLLQYEQGLHQWHGSYLVFGLQLFRNRGPDKDFLCNSKQGLKAWKKRAPGNARVPAPEEVILALADAMLDLGELQACLAA